METESGDIKKSAERNTDAGHRATSIVEGNRVPAWLAGRVWLVDAAILVLALVLRLWSLDAKPAHFDEGVNGYLVDEMTKNGFYHYDPTNFHGPLHFYVLFAMQTLFGREVWILRLPLALAGMGCVTLLLYGFRRNFSATACRLAAVAMAVSPGFVFYSRYAIHETWLVLFLIMTVVGIAGLWRDGAKGHLWWVGCGIAGAVMMKETWIIHLVAMALAVPTLRLIERVFPSAPMPWAATRGIIDDAARVFAICFAIVVFFFMGCLLDPAGAGAMLDAFVQWTRTGMGETGHEKPPYYWAELLLRYEWPALIGVAASGLVVLPNTHRFLRWLAIGAGGSLAAYSIIAYKTPWCLIAWAWPFFLVFGVGVEWLVRRVDRWVIGGFAGVLLLMSLAMALRLNFDRYADENEPYVYVQTTNDIRYLLDPLKWQAERDPTSIFNAGHVIQEEHHPMMWLFGTRPNVTWNEEDGEPDPMDADWLLVDSLEVDRIEEKLTRSYFRTPVQIRGMSPDESVLYLSESAFAEYFPGRDPEFQPDERTMRTELEGGKLPEKAIEDFEQ